tara:strand:+ start:15254 stop:15868 length:615 start_codon:yes stop_codon:yes gene_type:complete
MSVLQVKLKDNSLVDVIINSGDIVIDCGANIGDITNLFINHGAIVLAYEPNDRAFDVLSNRFKNNRNVRCFKAAVSSSDGVSKLYMHQKSPEDPLKYSTGSSLVSEKSNVNIDDYVEVKTIDLNRIIQKIKNKFKKNIQVLKIDIEGAECDLLEHLLDNGALHDIPYVFVETHEKKIPSLRPATEEIKRRVQEENLKNINFKWI